MTRRRTAGLHLRAMGDQEYDITKSVANVTKYCEMVIDPMRIRFCVEKALYYPCNGNPGLWLDIPLNVQAAMIETDDLIGFDPEDYEAGGTGWAAESASEIPEDTAGKGEFRAKLPARVTKETARAIIEKVRTSKRPVINAGNGIRIGAAHDVFMRVVEKLGIPVVTGADSIDCIYDEHPLYIGKGGNVGDRPGNFAIQNSDLVLSLGSRLSFRRPISFCYLGAQAYVIVNDIDAEELEKADPACGHAGSRGCEGSSDRDGRGPFGEEKKADALASCSQEYKDAQAEWLRICQGWKHDYPVVLPKHMNGGTETEANVYAFAYEMSRRLNENQIVVVGNGSANVVCGHVNDSREKGQRFISNSRHPSMNTDFRHRSARAWQDHSQDIILIRRRQRYSDGATGA